jgi:hypothetical protein
MTSAMIPRDRPAPAGGEVEITSEMIEAGVKALSTFSRMFDSIEDGPIRVYRAMETARRTVVRASAERAE